MDLLEKGKKLFYKTFRPLKSADSLWVYPAIDFKKLSQADRCSYFAGFENSAEYGTFDPEILTGADLRSVFKFVIRKYPQRLFNFYKTIENEELIRLRKLRTSAVIGNLLKLKQERKMLKKLKK